jgi:Inner membrane protein YgaP-like, transmembrane domain
VKLAVNVGTVDRIIRFALGVALVAVALAGSVAAPLVYVVWIVAAIALVTGAVGFCPLYSLFGFSTAGKRAATGR